MHAHFCTCTKKMYHLLDMHNQYNGRMVNVYLSIRVVFTPPNYHSKYSSIFFAVSLTFAAPKFS